MSLSRAQVRYLQEALLAQGYALPRWGADGSLGPETIGALETWAADHREQLPPGVQLEQLAQLVVAAAPSLPPLVVPGQRILDVRTAHPGRARKGRNPWTRIDTCCLHQMACRGPGGWERWRDLASHFAVLAEGRAAWLYDLDALLWHGHGWNGRSVGLEFEGWFAGVEARPETLWAPPHAPAARRRSMILSAEQAEAGREAVRLAVATVAAHGGRVRYLAAHRQSCAEKVSDPGEQIWQAVALPMKAELGLATAPTLSGGRPIPEAWDPGAKGVPY